MAGYDYNRNDILINMIKSFPTLYDFSHPSYTNTKTVELNIWKRIAENMRKSTGRTVEGEKEVQFCV